MGEFSKFFSCSFIVCLSCLFFGIKYSKMNDCHTSSPPSVTRFAPTYSLEQRGLLFTCFSRISEIHSLSRQTEIVPLVMQSVPVNMFSLVWPDSISMLILYSKNKTMHINHFSWTMDRSNSIESLFIFDCVPFMASNNGEVFIANSSRQTSTKQNCFHRLSVSHEETMSRLKA